MWTRRRRRRRAAAAPTPCCASHSRWRRWRAWAACSWASPLPDRGLLDRIVRPGALTTAFQPIFEIVDGRPRLHYLEALTRGPKGTSVETPEVLFEYARRKNRSAEVDAACVKAALLEARILPAAVRIGLNVHASTLATDPEFLNVVGDNASVN